MKYIFLAITNLCFCVNISLAAPATPPNPFARPSTLPFQAPPFDKIKDADYQPAFEAGMKQQLAEIDLIANNTATPTFDNTIAAMEKSGRMLARVSSAFDAMVYENSNPTLDKIQIEETPKLAAHQDAIYLNPKLFQRVKAIYEQHYKLNLDPEDLQLLKVYYQKFVHAGANLRDADKVKLLELNKELATLETVYQQKLTAANKVGKLVLRDKTELTGLSEDEIAALRYKDSNEEKYIISLQNTTQQPLLSTLTNRATREKLFKHAWNRTEQGDVNDTREIIATIAKKRAAIATLFGYPNYAAYVLYDQMVTSPTLIHQFLDQFVPPTTAKTNADAKLIQTTINKDDHFDLKPWDWDYYSEKIRKMQFDLDEKELKPYFELDTVLKNGVFYSANLLYGITFKERYDIPVYHPDVRVFDVYDKDGSQLGLIYFDYFKRDNKIGGAWTNYFSYRSKVLATKPIVYNVANFNKPAPGAPALLTFRNVVTMFHEFGHALHTLFAETNYPSSNNKIARDFVEFPSQFNEHWALYPEVLKHYAVHYKTGEPMSPALVDKIKKAASFNQGYHLAELLAAAELDLQWHELSSTADIQDVNAFEMQALKNTHTDFANIPPRYRSSYFSHIWSNGYAGRYYAYLWTQMLDNDAYAWFMKHGGLTRENGQRFRDLILSRGHTQDYTPLFNEFYGKAPDIEPMLEHLGIQSVRSL